MRKLKVTLAVEVYDTDEGPQRRAVAEQHSDYEGFKLPTSYFIQTTVGQLVPAVCKQLDILFPATDRPPPPPTPPVRIIKEGDTSRKTKYAAMVEANKLAAQVVVSRYHDDRSTTKEEERPLPSPDVLDFIARLRNDPDVAEDDFNELRHEAFAGATLPELVKRAAQLDKMRR